MLQVIVIFVWVGAMACIVTENDIEASSIIPQMKTLTWKDEVWYKSLFMSFGLLWILAAIEYLNIFIVITSACTYYFNNKRDITDE